MFQEHSEENGTQKAIPFQNVHPKSEPSEIDAFSEVLQKSKSLIQVSGFHDSDEDIDLEQVDSSKVSPSSKSILKVTVSRRRTDVHF